MKQIVFGRTAEAAAQDRESKWELIAAIAADATDADLPIVGAQSCLAAASALEAAGNEYSTETVRHLCSVAKFDHDSTPAQRKVWRTYGWTIVRRVASAGWSPEAAFGLLSTRHCTFREVMDAVGHSRSVRAHTGSFDERCDAWVHRANRLLMDGAALAEEASTTEIAVGSRAELALMIYQRLAERHLDAEIRQLLESAEVR